MHLRDRRRRNGWAERSEEHTSELQSPCNLVCRLLLEKKKNTTASLLRLHPNHEPYRRDLPTLRVSAATSNTAPLRDVTRGVYTTQERIHRDVQILDC